MYTCEFLINANLVKEGSFRMNAKLVKEELSYIQEYNREYIFLDTFKHAST